jgi:hypothetical protein
MSAYVVSADTVRLLLAVTDDYALRNLLRDAYPHKDMTVDMSGDDMRSIALRYILSVNARAVLYRYPDATTDTMPGDTGVEWRTDTLYRPSPVLDYVAPKFRVFDGQGGEIRRDLAPRVLGAAHCLAYQCCELPEWEATPAYRWLMRVHWQAASALSDGWDVSDLSDLAA